MQPRRRLAKPRRRRRRPPKAPVRIFRMTASSFQYDERKGQLFEHEMHFRIARRARTVPDVKRIRRQLEEKGRRHFHYWLLKHLKVRLDREVRVNFEHEERAKVQVPQAYASVRRFLMRRVKGRWTSKELPSGTMNYVRRRRRKKKKHVRG